MAFAQQWLADVERVPRDANTRERVANEVVYYILGSFVAKHLPNALILNDPGFEHFDASRAMVTRVNELRRGQTLPTVEEMTVFSLANNGSPADESDVRRGTLSGTDCNVSGM